MKNPKILYFVINFLAVAQILVSVLFIVISPVASERGWFFMVALFVVGGAGLVGGIGLILRRRWGIQVSLAINSLAAIVAIALTALVVTDLFRGRAAPESVGGWSFFLLPIVPLVFVGLLFRIKRQFRIDRP